MAKIVNPRLDAEGKLILDGVHCKDVFERDWFLQGCEHIVRFWSAEENFPRCFRCHVRLKHRPTTSPFEAADEDEEWEEE